MTAAKPADPVQSIYTTSPAMQRRNAAETRFRLYGLVAIALSLTLLAVMLVTIFRDGTSSFFQARLSYSVELTEKVLDPKGNRNREEMAKVTTVGYGKVLSAGLIATLEARQIDLGGLKPKEVAELISKDAAGGLRAKVLADPALVGSTIAVSVFASGRVDGFLKGRVTMESAKLDSNISPEQLQLADRLRTAGILSSGWNWDFFINPDASDQRPEAAGLGVALIGSLYLMILVAVMCVPVGVAASIYLEEFAPKNTLTDAIEVNVSNLAAVPSIVYGILGLSIFINVFGLPQSSSLVGALVISLMTLPTIIIATRASIRAVPPSIRDAALGVGASKMQMVFHHVLPLAMPGILTGTILGLAAGLGQSAPLLLIGMVAFVDNHPAPPLEGFLDPATALPVQIYTWVTRSDPAFVERSNGAIIVLLAFLVVMNLLAILARRKFERRW